MHSKREFLTVAGLGLGLAAAGPAFAQRNPHAYPPQDAPPLPNRMAKTTKLFKAPTPWPNALASSPQGLWVGQQNLTEAEAQSANTKRRTTGKEQVWLMDMSGKVLQTRESDAVNTSGVAYGGGSLWVMANTTDPSTGVYQVDVASGKQLAHRQIPLSPNNVTGGIHGAQWHDGKLWIVNNRMKSLIRMNTANWTAETQFPIPVQPGMGRYHDITFDKDGTILQVVATEKSASHTDHNVGGLVRMDATTGKPLETITFVPGSCDPHGLAYHNGMLIASDAGFHPGWNNSDSPSSQWIFRIDLI